MKDLKKIAIQTVPNGYNLTIGTTDFHYFNELDLLAGFIAHLGSEDTRELQRGNLLSTAFSLMLGEEYTKSVDNLKAKVDMCTKQSDEAMKKLQEKIKKANELLEKSDKIEERIKELSDRITETSKQFGEAKEENDKIAKEIADNKRSWNGIMDMAKQFSQLAVGASEQHTQTPPPDIPIKSRKRAKNDKVIMEAIEKTEKQKVCNIAPEDQIDCNIE